MPSMRELWWMFGMYVLGAALWVLAYLVEVFDRRPYTCGERWNDEWMNSFVPGQDGWPPPDRPDEDDDGEPIDVILLVGASLRLGACLHKRRYGDPVRGPPVRKLATVTRTLARTVKTDKSAGVEKS